MASMHQRAISSLAESARRAPSARLMRDVEKLRASLPERLPHTKSPTLVIISGLPGSGKSYFSRRLAARLPLVILESDALRKVLVAQPTYSGPESGRLFRAAHVLMHQLLAAGVPVLFDATNLIERHRKQLYRIAEELGAHVALVSLETKEDIAYHRLQRRQRGLDPNNKSDTSWEVYKRMQSAMDPIRREHLALDTSKDISSAIDQVVRWLTSSTGNLDSATATGMQ